MPTATLPARLFSAHDAFDGGRGYLAACAAGLPPRATRDAVIADVEAAARGRVDVAAYSASVERSRALFAQLVGVGADRVAIASQVSACAALIATAVPDDGEVLVPEGDFSSIVMPFVQAGRGIQVRTAPLHALADAITPKTALVAFSLVQSATGEVADADAIAAAARRHGARTFCDATQAVGWLPVAASGFDALVCHAYKWLCAPRGVAFLAVGTDLQSQIAPRSAAWYAGEDPWLSCYGGDFTLAQDARRFDVSPAWQAFVGAEPALELFASLDLAEVFAHTTQLAADFRARMGLPAPLRPSAIVTWDDPEGCDLARLSLAGLTASGRSGRARVAFHVFNDAEDVDLAARALAR
ncbi:aminotransferase class V-fold PLP-dependent enzyme [Microbacterium sp. SS28]|uniref:aminotransferase class V-fold PLP-dependent enzyme n=1 Tax=Microbacterium sp. SS28 TaxID=2919948 RepID=UPI001FAB14E6|nr:aminotransferase class V-fold PLP-dependent enzyme [Microbacterium sp. SS28]